MNINMNDSGDNDTVTMNDLLDSFNLMNNILIPAHRLQNILDVGLTDIGYTGII